MGSGVVRWQGARLQTERALCHNITMWASLVSGGGRSRGVWVGGGGGGGRLRTGPVTIRLYLRGWLI